MSQAVRYCIQCGREIGSSAVCTNPDCRGLPNFYREVSGPRLEVKEDHYTDSQARPPSGSQEAQLADDADPEAKRQTIPLSVEPLAMLRSVRPPIVEHLIYAGITDIGAQPPAKIRLSQPEVSAKHARIECVRNSNTDCEIILSDRGSTNGTYVNGKKIERCKLEGGEKVRFAKVEFDFRLIAEDQTRVTLPM